jgi:hypothetical protein
MAEVRDAAAKLTRRRVRLSLCDEETVATASAQPRGNRSIVIFLS